MRLPRAYCRPLSNGEVRLDEAESRHLRQVLRLAAGDEVELFDGAGGIGRGRIATSPASQVARRRSRSDAMVVVMVETIGREPAAASTLTLVVAAPKGERLDWMIEKTVELGADHILLTTFERSPAQSARVRVDRLDRIALEACKQSHRAWLPAIGLSASPTAALSSLTSNGESPPGSIFIAHPVDGAPTFADVIRGGTSSAIVVIGPEGGLTATERSALQAAGGVEVLLAATILRVETAAAAVAAAWAGSRASWTRGERH